MNKKKLKIDFCDFWGDFDKHQNLFINLLQKYYDVTISEDPDVLIYSCYGFNYIKYNCYKIFYTAENIRPDFFECDFAFSFDYPEYDNRNFRLPLYRWRGDLENLVYEKNDEQIILAKKKFCCIVISNPKVKERNLFFEKLSEYKKVDSGGKYLNNIGYVIKNKMDFIADYKFTISFENSSYPGYTTEKIVEPMLKESIPIYWGNYKINEDFNHKSFINIHDYNSFDEAIKEIIRIDNNNELYKKYLRQPYFVNNKFPLTLEWDFIAKKLYAVIESFNMLSKKDFRRKTYSYIRKFKRKLYYRLLHKHTW